MRSSRATGKEAEKWITKATQLKVLESPVTVDVLQAFRTAGPSTVAEVAQRIGRQSVSLHYHVRRLKSAGFLRVVDTKRSGARTQSIYDVTAKFFRYRNAPENPGMQKVVGDIVASLLRLAVRNFQAAIGRPDSVREEGGDRNLLADRLKARLSKHEIAAVNRHLRAAERIFTKCDRTKGGELITLTVVMTPEPDRSDTAS